jgi:hypothetical protein
MAGGEYSQKDVNTIFKHLSIKTVRDWQIRKLYGWGNEWQDKRGIHRKYDLFNLYQIGIVEELSSCRVPILYIKGVMEKHFNAGEGIREKRESGLPKAHRSAAHPDILLMEKMLIIYKPGERKGTRKEGNFDETWKNILVERGELADFVRNDNFYGIIITNLPKIKRQIDAMILEVT